MRLRLFLHVDKNHTLIVLNIVTCFTGSYRIASRDIIVHQSRPSKQTETSRGTKNAPKHVFCCFLKPMTDSIFKLLIPYYWALKNKSKIQWLFVERICRASIPNRYLMYRVGPLVRNAAIWCRQWVLILLLDLVSDIPWNTDTVTW
jgi:hypothetical protein